MPPRRSRSARETRRLLLRLRPRCPAMSGSFLCNLPTTLWGELLSPGVAAFLAPESTGCSLATLRLRRSLGGRIPDDGCRQAVEVGGLLGALLHRLQGIGRRSRDRHRRSPSTSSLGFTSSARANSQIVSSRGSR